MRDRFTRVLKGHIALALARFPKGTTGTQLDGFARRALWQEGLDYDHGTGHGVGSYLGVHEGPQRISKAPNTQPLLPGMIVSNEPGYYKTDAYGIRIENLVLVQPAEGSAEREMLGFETLTLAPIDRNLIEPSLLDEDEIAWLNAYHTRVRDTLTPLVDARHRALARRSDPTSRRMIEPQGSELFPTPDPVEADRQRDLTTGLLPSQLLREAVAQGREILSPQPIGDDQIQPASIDLRLGEVAYRVRASFLPGARASVRDKLELLSMHRIDLTGGAVLEKDCVYIVPLLEYVSLRRRTAAAANPKSSTGRLDVFARVITDFGTEFDRVREGYKGPLFAEISPRAFSILVRTGSRLVQLRVRRGSPGFSDTALRRLHEEVRLVDGPAGPKTIRNGLAFTVDVGGDQTTGIVGYKARRHTDVIDVDRSLHYDPRDFWEPVYSHRGPGDQGASSSTPTTSTSWRHARRLSCRPIMPPRCCPTTPSSANSGCITPGFSIPASAPPRAAEPAAAPSSKCARTKCRS